MEGKKLDKELLDDLLELFVVLFLKSDEAVKVTLLVDIQNVFLILKQNETRIFVDRLFKYRILFYGISQFKHCLKQAEAGKKDGSMPATCPILTNSFKAENAKKNSSEINGGQSLSAEGCNVHGTINIKQETFALDDDPEKFIQFICFLATLKFKLHHIFNTTELNHARKQNECKFICNILFLFLQYCEPKYLIYPLRALAEFLSQE